MPLKLQKIKKAPSLIKTKLSLENPREYFMVRQTILKEGIFIQKQISSSYVY